MNRSLLIAAMGVSLGPLAPRQASAEIVVVEPDNYMGGVPLFPVFIRLGPGSDVGPAYTRRAEPERYGPASTGSWIFDLGTDGGSTSESNRYMRVDFLAFPTDFVSIDMIGTDTQNTTGVLRAFNSVGVQIAFYQTLTVGRGAIETAIISRASADISYITAGGLPGNNRLLDNFRYNVVPEPSSLALAVCGFAALVLVVLFRRPRRSLSWGPSRTPENA